MTNFCEERVFHAQEFFGATFDFRWQIVFWRFDACVFVDCKILIDTDTNSRQHLRAAYRRANGRFRTTPGRGLGARKGGSSLI
jgi:hypothetical protein